MPSARAPSSWRRRVRGPAARTSTSQPVGVAGFRGGYTGQGASVSIRNGRGNCGLTFDAGGVPCYLEGGCSAPERGREGTSSPANRPGACSRIRHLALIHETVSSACLCRTILSISICWASLRWHAIGREGSVRVPYGRCPWSPRRRHPILRLCGRHRPFACRAQESGDGHVEGASDVRGRGVATKKENMY